MTSDQIKESFLKFFEKHGHAIIEGASLVPENDPTVLFTTAGMHPLVPYLLGEPHPMGRRLANVQRCVRTDDIDEVGDTHQPPHVLRDAWELVSGGLFQRRGHSPKLRVSHGVASLGPQPFVGFRFRRR